ncbi:MAG: MFS transporter [Rhodospirillales bacterium]|nr:MFS transporter [Rhodospirillales bacterium]
MRSTLFTISALLLGAGAINLGLGLQVSLLGLRAGIENFSTVMTGLIMSSYYVGFIVGSIGAPPIIRKVGHIRTFSVFASLASAAALCHAVFLDPVWWIVLRALTGLCFSALSLVTESWLNERSTNATRGALLSSYFITILGATALGQVLLMLAPVAGYDLFVLVSVIISVALIPVALTSTPMPVNIEPTRMRLGRLFNSSPIGVVGCLGAGLGTGAFWGLGAVYAQGIGLPKSEIVAFMTFVVVGGMVAQWPFGRLSDRIDRRWVIAGMSIAMGLIGTVITTRVISEPPWLFLIAATAGGVLLPLYSISIAHTNDQMEAKDFVPASATLLLVFGIGAAAGPFIATLFMHYAGPEGLFIHAATTSALVGLFALYRMALRPASPKDETTEFTVIPQTTVMAIQMDPRAEYEEEVDQGEAMERPDA